MATDALLAKRASSLPAASQVFIAACRAKEASSRAWAIVGRRVAQLDHFSGKLLFGRRVAQRSTSVVSGYNQDIRALEMHHCKRLAAAASLLGLACFAA